MLRARGNFTCGSTAKALTRLTAHGLKEGLANHEEMFLRQHNGSDLVRLFRSSADVGTVRDHDRMIEKDTG